MAGHSRSMNTSLHTDHVTCTQCSNGQACTNTLKVTTIAMGACIYIHFQPFKQNTSQQQQIPNYRDRRIIAITIQCLHRGLTMNCSTTSNTSNLQPNGTDVESEGPRLYSWCMLIFAYIPIVTLTVTVLVAVIGAKAIPVTVRLVLVNILAASLTSIIGTAMGFLNSAILTSTNHLSSSDTACRVYYWLINTGGTARLSFMATFAVVVFIIIRCSNTAVRPIILILSVVAIWMFVIIFNAQLFSSQIVVSNFLDNSGCVPHLAAPIGLVYAVPFAIIFVLVPVTLAISLPCAACCFIQKNITTMERRPLLSKAMVKFTLFLLLGNTLGVLGQSTPVLLAVITKENGNIYNDKIDRAITYVNGILLTLSFIPTPILILLCFKPVRELLWKLVIWLYTTVITNRNLLQLMTPHCAKPCWSNSTM